MPRPHRLCVWATSKQSNTPAPRPSPQHTHKRGLFHGGEQTRPEENAAVQPQFLRTKRISPVKHHQEVPLSTTTDSSTSTNLPLAASKHYEQRLPKKSCFFISRQGHHLPPLHQIGCVHPNSPWRQLLSAARTRPPPALSSQPACAHPSVPALLTPAAPRALGSLSLSRQARRLQNASSV